MAPWRLMFHALRFALGSLWSYRLRSSLTSLGVTMGVATVIAILSIIEGLDRSIQSTVSQIGTGTLYVTQHPWIVFGGWWRFRNCPRITPGEARRLEEQLTLAHAVVPFVHARATVEIGKTPLKEVRVIGSTADWPIMSGIVPKEGRFFSAGEGRAGRDVVIAGADVVEELARQGIDLGERIRVAGRPLRLIGTLPNRGRIFGQSQDDFVLVPLPLFERMFGERRSLSIGVVSDPDRLPEAMGELTGAMRAIRHLRPGDDNNFSINEQSLLVELYQKLTGSLFATAIGLGIITLIVAGVGIMNIMLVAVAERTREIGIRKALGARPSVILAQFLIEAGLVSSLGAIAGTGLGLLLARLVASLTPLPAAVPMSGMVLGLGFGVLVGIAFGFLPAYRAARLLPVEALAQGAS